jgi:hypothetical protein
MLVVLTETYCNKENIQITQRDDFIQIEGRVLIYNPSAKYVAWKKMLPTFL